MGRVAGDGYAGWMDKWSKCCGTQALRHQRLSLADFVTQVVACNSLVGRTACTVHRMNFQHTPGLFPGHVSDIQNKPSGAELRLSHLPSGNVMHMGSDRSDGDEQCIADFLVVLSVRRILGYPVPVR